MRDEDSPDSVERWPIGSIERDEDAERTRHIELIDEQLVTGTCTDWEQLSSTKQRIQISHDEPPTFQNLFAELRESGWVPSAIDIDGTKTELTMEKLHDLGNRITFTDCDECGAEAIEFGGRVEGQGLSSGERVYCTACGAEWTVSFKVNNCDRGCCPFDREIVLDPVYSESQKIGPASDEFDTVTLIRGLEPEAKIEFYQQTRPSDKIDLYESPEEAPDTLVEGLRSRNGTDGGLSFEERSDHWEERLASLDE